MHSDSESDGDESDDDASQSQTMATLVQALSDLAEERERNAKRAKIASSRRAAEALAQQTYQIWGEQLRDAKQKAVDEITEQVKAKEEEIQGLNENLSSIISDWTVDTVEFTELLEACGEKLRQAQADCEKQAEENDHEEQNLRKRLRTKLKGRLTTFEGQTKKAAKSSERKKQRNLSAVSHMLG